VYIYLHICVEIMKFKFYIRFYYFCSSTFKQYNLYEQATRTTLMVLVNTAVLYIVRTYYYYYYIFAKKKTVLLHVFVFTILYVLNIHGTNLKTEAKL